MSDLIRPLKYKQIGNGDVDIQSSSSSDSDGSGFDVYESYVSMPTQSADKVDTDADPQTKAPSPFGKVGSANLIPTPIRMQMWKRMHSVVLVSDVKDAISDHDSGSDESQDK